MGPLGWQETVFIFVLALVIFGPKKLPELGRNIGKALSEFRRASGELKATFDREMEGIDRENRDLKYETQKIASDINNSYYDQNNHSNYHGEDYHYYDGYSDASYNNGASQSGTETVATVEGEEAVKLLPAEGAVNVGSDTVVAVAEEAVESAAPPADDAAASQPEKNNPPANA
jgi:TatA/E family protein of Tat protein translocase